jgi:Zn-dependent protease
VELNNMTEKRDPRAHWLDEDPFDQMNNNSKTHTRTRDDGNWRKPHIRVVTRSNVGKPFFRTFATENSEPKKVHTGSIWHFSKTEKEHLFQAVFAFTIALGFFATNGIFNALAYPLQFVKWAILLGAVISPAFLLHEIAHKITARSYQCWAEFRVSPGGLRFGIILAALTGWVFMAPGAVMIYGYTTKSQFGKVALAGPLSNIVLWVIGIFLILLGLETSGSLTVPFADKERGLLWWWCISNGGLALFNMIPFGPLDGKKIKKWSDSIFFFWFIVCISLVWFNSTQLTNLIS